MAKLARITQKIFGSGAGTDQIGKFGSLFATGVPAYTTDPTEAMSLSNWLVGWFGAAIGGNAPAIQDVNAIPFVETYQLAYLFQAGIAEWDSGTTYYIGSLVNVSGVIYRSLTDNNTGNSIPDASNWKLFSTEPVASGKDFWGSSLPDGWVWADGKTIGDAASNGTSRASADTQDLFTILWTSYSDSILPIYLSNGSLSTRGASAAVDFAANKAVTLPDKRGRVSAVNDALGGSAASRLTSTTMTPNGTTIGAVGGEQTHTLTLPESPAHDHGGQAGGNQFLSTQPGGAASVTGGANVFQTATIASAGGGGAHNNVQPSIVCNYILKL